MIGDLLAAARRELPLWTGRDGRFLFWVLALLAYFVGLVGVGLVALDDARRASTQILVTSIALQVPAEASDARLQTVVALLRQTPGIVSVHLLEPAETARLLEPWLGPSAPLDDLPVPRLIDLRIDPGRDPDIAALQQKLTAVLPGAQLDNHRGWPKRMRGAARRAETILAVWIAAGLLLMAAAAAVTVGNALRAPRSVGALLRMLGATDSQIAGAVAMRLLRLGALAGVIGASAALLTLTALHGAGSMLRLPAPVSEIGVANWPVWAVLGASVAAAGLIAMASAWVAARRRLAAMP